MGIIVGIPRVVVAVGLIASLVFSVARPCVCGDLPIGHAHPIDHGSSSCSCDSATGHCSCDASCHCMGPLPQQGHQAALPNLSDDWSQPLLLSAGEIAGTTPCSANPTTVDPAHVAGFVSTLFAQGTRLNC